MTPTEQFLRDMACQKRRVELNHTVEAGKVLYHAGGRDLLPETAQLALREACQQLIPPLTRQLVGPLPTALTAAPQTAGKRTRSANLSPVGQAVARTAAVELLKGVGRASLLGWRRQWPHRRPVRGARLLGRRTDRRGRGLARGP